MAVTLYEQARALVERAVSAAEFGTFLAADATGIQLWPSAEIEQALVVRDQLAELLATASDAELNGALNTARRDDDDLLAQAISAEVRRRSSAS